MLNLPEGQMGVIFIQATYQAQDSESCRCWGRILPRFFTTVVTSQGRLRPQKLQWGLAELSASRLPLVKGPAEHQGRARCYTAAAA